MPNASVIIRPLGDAIRALQQYGQRFFTPPNENIRNIDNDDWGSPLQPIAPMGPESSEPASFQIWPGQNLIFTPRSDSEYSAAMLKSLATYPLARICIENVKDTLISKPWEIQARPRPGETKKQASRRSVKDETLLNLNKLFERPDRENTWSDWLRLLLEDMLVIDAASILIRKTFKGQIVELPVIRGEMIVRYIDKNGWTPQPPDPAYAQLWWGIPRVDLTTDQLVYRPRNIVPRNTISSQLYGMSPTESVAEEIQIGIYRLEFIKQYYVSGSVPGVVQVVPPGTDVDKIAEAMSWMNSELAGNLSARRQWRLVQGWAAKPNEEKIEFTKEQLLSDPFDDQHMRRIAFAYGTSPQRLAKQMNRATAEQADEAASDEGMRPFLYWIKSVMDYLIQVKFGYAEYEWVADESKEPDPAKEEAIITGYVKGGVMTPNEGRERIGEEPVDDPGSDELGTMTANGWVTFQQSSDQHEQNLANSAMLAQPKTQPQGGGSEEGPGNQGGGGGGGRKTPPKAKKPNGKITPGVYGFATALDGVEPAAGTGRLILRKGEKVEARISPAHLEPDSLLARHQLQRTLVKHFRTMNKMVARRLRQAVGITTKAAGDDDDTLNAILSELAAEWRAIAEEARGPFIEAAIAGSQLASAQLEIKDAQLLTNINRVAEQWASERAAELVGMKWSPNGRLIPNPDAQWAISDTTREKLREIITNVFSMESPTARQIQDAIAEAGPFSESRAQMIAHTEIARAQTLSNLRGWQASGMVASVKWQMSADHAEPDECDTYAAGSPYAVNQVPGYPAHPRCECTLVIHKLAGEE